MKKHIEKIKKQAADEAMKTSFIVLGAVGGLIAAHFGRKAIESNPTLSAVAKFGIPALLAGGGFIISAATDSGSKAKYFGYGLATAGVIDGIRITAIGKEYLSGILGDTEIPAASAFYTESEERQKLISGFGLADLPVGNASLQSASNNGVSLPDLEGPEELEGLGYNADQVDLGYNAAQTDDDIKGIL